MIKTPNFFIVKVIEVLIGELIENKSYERDIIEKKRAAERELFQIGPNFSNWPMIDNICVNVTAKIKKNWKTFYFVLYSVIVL